VRTVVVAIALTVATATAAADPEKAKALSAEAEALVGTGDLIGAAAKFRAAFKEEPRPEHMCNSGVAYHKAKDLPRAHRYLNACVTMGSSLEVAYRDNLRKVVESIEQKLVASNFTPIDIAIEPPTGVLVIEGGKPYDEEIVGGGRLWVPYGAYRFVVRAPGFVESRSEVTANSHVAMPLRVTLEKQPEKPIEKPIETPIEKPIATPITTVEQPSKLPAIIATSATGAAGVGNETSFDRLRNKSKSNQHISWVVGGVAGVGAIVSGYLWWRVLRAPDGVEVTATGTGVAVRGRF
jgi:hypothetical protein